MINCKYVWNKSPKAFKGAHLPVILSQYSLATSTPHGFFHRNPYISWTNEHIISVNMFIKLYWSTLAVVLRNFIRTVVKVYKEML